MNSRTLQQAELEARAAQGDVRAKAELRRLQMHNPDEGQQNIAAYLTMPILFPLR